MRLIKAKITETGLWVNKYKCNSVTITQLEKDKFEAVLFNIDGISKRVPVLYRRGPLIGIQKLNSLGERIFRTQKLKKRLISERVEIEKDDTCRGSVSCIKNSKGEYINFYPLEVKE